MKTLTLRVNITLEEQVKWLQLCGNLEVRSQDALGELIRRQLLITEKSSARVEKRPKENQLRIEFP